MKKMTVCIFVFGLLFGCTVHAGESLNGVYLGVKIGAGMARDGSTTFGMDAGSAVEAGDVYSWEHQRVNMGYNTDTVLGGGASIGYDFSKRFSLPVRFELDYTALDKAKDSKTKSATFDITYNGTPMSATSNIEVQTSIGMQTLMPNVWFDIPTGTKFTPYFGGGAGAAFVRHKSVAIEEPGTPFEERISNSRNFCNFAWTVGAGVGYAINDCWSMDLGYRYVDAGNSKMHYPQEGGVMYTGLSRITSHNVMLGVRRTF